MPFRTVIVDHLPDGLIGKPGRPRKPSNKIPPTVVVDRTVDSLIVQCVHCEAIEPNRFPLDDRQGVALFVRNHEDECRGHPVVYVDAVGVVTPVCLRRFECRRCLIASPWHAVDLQRERLLLDAAAVSHVSECPRRLPLASRMGDAHRMSVLDRRTFWFRPVPIGLQRVTEPRLLLRTSLANDVDSESAHQL